jgi:hypothetical protein
MTVEHGDVTLASLVEAALQAEGLVGAETASEQGHSGPMSPLPQLCEVEGGSGSDFEIGIQSPVSTGKVVLVTGGGGFVGSHVAEALLERGDSVIIVDEMNPYYDVRVKYSNVEELVARHGQRVTFVQVSQKGPEIILSTPKWLGLYADIICTRIDEGFHGKESDWGFLFLCAGGHLRPGGDGEAVHHAPAAAHRAHGGAGGRAALDRRPLHLHPQQYRGHDPPARAGAPLRQRLLRLRLVVQRVRKPAQRGVLRDRLGT